LTISPGAQLGPYEIVSPIGAGGMGEVYRAKDTKLGRDVALKILPESFVHDPERIARFRREAHVLAALNHPHIAQIHCLEEANGSQFLVLELVDGESLDKRISSGPIHVEEALRIAKQIAEALEAAHEKGIIHRDLKPANIALTKNGHVKVLDFGLAKAAADGLAVDPESPTMTVGSTREGLILGTAAYMSPEQALGKPVDRRTDIWAFGCVLYEMLTGRRAFGGETVTHAVAAILEREPDWSALPPATPPRARQLLQRCLEKDPRRRLHHVADARIELEDLHAVRPPAAELPRAAPAAGQRQWRPTVLVVAAAAAIVAGGAVALRYLTPSPLTGPATRLSISASGRITPQLSAAISPEGRRVAFVSTDADGRSMMWIRALDSLQARVVPGTEDAAHPFWSPDGRSLGFIAGGKLKRVDAEGGGVQTLAETGGFRTGGAWNRGGVIIFSPAGQQLAAVPASGGPVSHLAASGIWPSFLPDDRHFLYWSSGSAEPRSRGVYVGSLNSSVTKQLISSDFKGAYAAPGYLLFVRDETLLAQSFDADRLELRGEPTVVAEGVWGASTAAQASFSVSPTGTLAYVNATLHNMQVLAFDRSGRPQGPVTQPDRYFDVVPQLSPSGKQMAIARGPYGHESIWLFDLATSTSSRLTLNPDWSHTPVWSSDGARVIFMSGRGPGVAGSRLNLKNVNGVGQDEVLLELTPPAAAALWDWSSDGRFIVYSVVGEARRVADLWVLPLDGARKPYPFLQSAFHKTQAQIAPNGKWIAYTSYESGKDEVYVQSFPLPGSKRQISIDGGVQPRWRRDGAELFYLALNQTLMAVPIKDDGRFEAGPPVPLFRTKMLPQGSQSTWFFTAYDVTADGRRFVLNVPPEDPGPPITVVLNWMAVGK